MLMLKFPKFQPQYSYEVYSYYNMKESVRSKMSLHSLILLDRQSTQYTLEAVLYVEHFIFLFLFFYEPTPNQSSKVESCWVIRRIHDGENRQAKIYERGGRNDAGSLRTVPTIVIAHTFCAPRDTRVSYR